MHMADALLSFPVAGVMLTVSGASLVIAGKKSAYLGEEKIPLLGVMGAFVFAAQMVNFTIPGTGASGHIGGGILLAALLGPAPALLVMAAVLLIQCLFFADGGLLAYGCNLFNLGICSSVLAYYLVYRPLAGNPKRLSLAAILSAVVGLQLGSLALVGQVCLSGMTKLPFGAFAALMQPIHLLIGLAEGLITAGVLIFIRRVRPELLYSREKHSFAWKKPAVVILVIAVLLAGGLSILASAQPDGLEWALEKLGFQPGEDDAYGSPSLNLLGSGVVLIFLTVPGYLLWRLKKRPRGEN
ncbi:MAG: energy-coupling factor ABC transporter permease [Clostridiales bacterium]|nr:energy-coupling factor ABC transporter permease [Clostridiales bacterium]